jgi:uncharacterized protein
MEVEFVNDKEIKFEWDEKKRKINLEKHGVDFEDAKAFFNEPYIVKQDGRFDYGEERYIALGLINHQEMVLVFTKRDENCFRIISCRKASHKEAKRYYEYIKNQMASH